MSETNGHGPAGAVDPAYDWGADDLEPKVFPVRIRGKDYVLKSASTGAAVKYRNACTKAARWEGTPGSSDIKVTGWDGLADTEPLLVQLCTFEVLRQPGGEVRHGPVAAGWVLALPPEVTQKLFGKILEISPNLKGQPDGEPAATRDDAAADGTEEPCPKG